jgi:hypothetical protein
VFFRAAGRFRRSSPAELASSQTSLSRESIFEQREEMAKGVA